MYNILVFFFYQGGPKDGNYSYPFYKKNVYKKISLKTPKTLRKC